MRGDQTKVGLAELIRVYLEGKTYNVSGLDGLFKTVFHAKISELEEHHRANPRHLK